MHAKKKELRIVPATQGGSRQNSVAGAVCSTEGTKESNGVKM